MEFKFKHSPTPEDNPDHTAFTYEKSEVQLSETLRELEVLAQHTLTQMREQLDIGYYNLMIGDDVSGRLPALIFKGVIDNVYTKKKFTKPDVCFFAGESDQSGTAAQTKQDAITQALSSMKRKLGPLRILVVTEFVTEGSGMRILNDAILSAGAQYDLAVMIFNTGNQNTIKTNISPSQIFYGRRGVAPPLFHTNKSSELALKRSQGGYTHKARNEITPIQQIANRYKLL